MQLFVANCARMVQEAMARALKPPPPVDYLHFAETRVVFSQRESPFPGPYNRKLFPHFDEILIAISPADPCRIVTLSKSAQLGGTVLANIFTLGSVYMDPGDFMYNHPTIDNAQRWSKMKLAPQLKSIPDLARLFPQKSRDGSDSVLYKERVDGLGAILISGANSPASLSMVTVKRQVQDDLAKWDMNAAGDPEVQADTRSQAHEFAKVLKISTPMVVPGCRITRSYEEGSQEVPEVPCPHCDHFQVLEWDNMLAHLDEAAPEKAHFVCPDCGGVIEEHHRPAMLERLRWHARNPKMKRVHRSFWIWSAYSVLQSWERIARAWFKAKGDPASEQTFMNDVAGLPYRAIGEAVAWEVLRDRAAESPYPRGRIPAGCLIVVVGVDCQGDRVEAQVVAYTRDGRRFVIDYLVLPGHISDPGCQTLLDGLVEQTWPNVHGRKLGVDMLAIDGNAWTEDVWSWARRHPASRVIMVRGANSDHAPLLQRVKRERGAQGQLLKYSRRFYNFGASVLKLSLYRNLQKTDPLERGYVGFPLGLDDEFYRQLTAERRKPLKKAKDGFTVYRWVKEPTQANEGLDTHLQAEAAAIRLGVRALPDAEWDRLERERECPPVAQQLDLEDLMTATAPAAAHEPAPVREADAPDANAVRTDDWVNLPEGDWLD